MEMDILLEVPYSMPGETVIKVHALLLKFLHPGLPRHQISWWHWKLCSSGLRLRKTVSLSGGPDVGSYAKVWVEVLVLEGQWHHPLGQLPHPRRLCQAPGYWPVLELIIRVNDMTDLSKVIVPSS